MNTSLRQVVSELRRGLITSKEICDKCIARAEKVRELNAFITQTPEDAVRKAAVDADNRLQNGASVGLLDGIPVAVKDNFNTAGIQTTCASKMLRGYIPPYDATVVHRLLTDGAVLMGKTNMDEFAMGTGTVDSCYGPVRNPWRYNFSRPNRNSELPPTANYTSKDRKRCIDGAAPNRHFHKTTADMTSMPQVALAAPVAVTAIKPVDDYDDWYICGGSSGGSAVTVAVGITFASIGSDTGGSVRSPAGHLGVVGLKPTYGLVSRHGLIPLVNSLDTPGIFTRYVDDVAIVLNAIAGHCSRDSTTVHRPYSPIHLPDEPIMEGLCVGIPKEFYGPTLDEDTYKCWCDTISAMERAGAVVKEVSIPHNQYSTQTYSVLCCAEVASNMARYDGIQYGHRSSTSWSTEDLFAATRHEGFNDVVRGRILAGNYFLLKENYDKFYLKAQKVRRLLANDFQRVFAEGVDFLLTPTNISDGTKYMDFCKEDNRTRIAQHDIYTLAANLVGVPAVVVPTTLSSNLLPIGLQIIGNHFSEKAILSAAKWLETHSNFPRLDLDAVLDIV